jgi:hypothetical protein
MLRRFFITLPCFVSLLGASPVAEGLSTDVGLLRGDLSATTLSAPGEHWEQVLDLGPAFRADAADPVVLEIDEVHQARGQAFLYTVFVEDQPVYVRTFQELLAAPCTVMVAFDRKHVGDPRAVRVRLTRGEGGAVSITRVRAHGDFYAQARAQGLEQPMGVYDYVDLDFSRAASVRTRYPDGQRLRSGVMFGFQYLDRGRAELAADLDQALAIVASQRLPFAVMFSRWWSHTATSSDGQGGNYGDLVYNQITWDPESQALALTTPNEWGNTPWPSMQHEGANRAAQAQLTAATRHLADRHALLSAAQPGGLPPAAFVMEWGSGYWNLADMSRRVRDAAQADGVRLSVDDGLDAREIAWMQRSIATYNHELAQAYVAGLGSDPIAVPSDATVPPDQQLAQAIFTHCLHGIIYPSYDDRLPGWVGGVGPLMWPSSEMYEFTDDRHYRYSLSQGRLACVNLEMTMLKDHAFRDYLGRAYALGMDFLVMFNPDKVNYSVSEQIAHVDRLNDQPCPPLPIYRRHVFDINYLRDAQAGEPAIPPTGVKHQALFWVPADKKSHGFVRQSNPGEPGRIEFVLRDPQAFATGLRLEVEARAQSGTVSVWAGPTPDRLTRVATLADGQPIDWFNRHTHHEVNLDSVARGQGQVAVELRIEGAKVASSVRAVRAFLPWPVEAGPVGFRPDTYGERRLQNRWIQARVVVQRLREAYERKAGIATEATLNQAARLENEGRLGEAARLLSADMSRTLPSSFVVKGGERRLQNRWIQARVVVQRLREAYERKSGIATEATLNQAARLENEGRLGEAARLLSADMSRTLPARFTVKEGGRLDPLPLEVRVPGMTAVLTVLESSQHRLRLRAAATTAGELELRSTDSVGRQGTVSVESDGTQVITWGAGEGASSAWIRLPVAALGPVRPLVHGPEVVARISQVEADALWVEIPGLPLGSADPERIQVPLAAGWTSTRTPAESAPVAVSASGHPQPWDRARLQLNEKGEVLAVAAEFGLVEGKITRYEPPDLTQLNPHNGRLTLDNGLVYEFSFAKDHTHLDLPPLKGLALEYRLPQLAEALKPGLPVRIHYAPPVHTGASRRIVRLEALPH